MYRISMVKILKTFSAFIKFNCDLGGEALNKRQLLIARYGLNELICLNVNDRMNIELKFIIAFF